MKTLTATLAILGTLTFCIQPAFCQTAPTNGCAVATVFLIDDQTGEELARVHGIQPLCVPDLETLINGVLRGGAPVRLLHQAVDEDASDNAVAQMDFRPYAGGRPPQPPSPNQPLRLLTEAMKVYREQRTAWQRGMLDYRGRLVAEVEGFQRGVSITQAEVSRRFDEILVARNGRDFNRSDICGSVAAASRFLGDAGLRILVLNTDANDLPATRAPRTTPLTPEELDPSIHLIFVNKSRLPEASPLFAGLPNPVHHADSMAEAMEIVLSMFGGVPAMDVAKAGGTP